ncbi:MAG: PQQ-binding-like beta-propeller repeat protein [Lachnospiraceae bacterium]|nr:PQQ-binding-like beta-propeller repeat protein [Lachnospiraceae bacterium]
MESESASGSSMHTVDSFIPTYTDETNPSNLIASTAIRVNDQDVSIKDYERDGTISFDIGRKYTDMAGIFTFRGNNFRSSPTYGMADMSKYKFQEIWRAKTGSVNQKGAYWSGNGWTGQPLMVRWPRATKRHMNMKRWAKRDDSLVEVIYASMDGYIYFLDLATGRPTRDAMYLGFTFKGAGALDPRGYPIMYVGSGYDSTKEGTSRAFIINLIDCSVMYTYGNDDPFSLRGHLSFFDSSSLVDAETDTLIQPGENGILYLIKLNTKYNERRGKVSINPDRVVKWRYQGKRSGSGSYWLGMETSCAIYKGYLFVADNGGHLMCLNLNTLRLRWCQDILDDSNSSPVLSMEGGKLYLYISTSFHLGWRSNSTVEIPIWKIDASDGSIVWKTSYTCHSVKDSSGGVQSTIALGHRTLAGNIYVTVSRTDNTETGVLACIGKRNGRIKWEHKGAYTWSSPVCVYNNNGKDVVIYGRSDSNLYMLDGLTGEEDDVMNLNSGVIEASPAVFKDMLVVGTRGCSICGIKLK